MVDFQYPYFLSFVHMFCNSLGTQYVFWRIKRDDKLQTESKMQKWLGHLVRKDLDKTGNWYIRWFSLIFSLNIAIGNVSLQHVSVNFNQVMRSLVPFFTILMGLTVGKTFTARRILSVIPLIVGVAMACFGDMTYDTLGFIYTLSCVLLAALKAVVAGEMLTGSLKLHPVDLLGHLAPLAMIQCICMSVITGEVYEILKRPELYLTDLRPMMVVMFSGICSFSLNITSLMTNKLTSPLTLTIAGNVKQVMMIAISTVIFATPITPLNGLGIVVVLIGSAIYSFVSLQEKKSSQSEASTKQQYALNGAKKDDTKNSVFDAIDDIDIGDVESIEEIEIGGGCDTSPHNLTSRSTSSQEGVRATKLVMSHTYGSYESDIDEEQPLSRISERQ
eukprot:CAMPEP_0178741724 /NCGR_PEP_ID=MMETSP0744-20121128/5298_1 /TAXON_ID=913974 /ORGANISM="Nitzschia punctata, Strain CCMP561" /LENGTH=388 /DNA_ID=CAMNT_0020394627 /DNA_START=102 /DNA_END=1268 /DNA_ORIENTATION=+